MGLSVISRGTLDEKLDWVFRLYDHSRVGYLTIDDFRQMVKSVYSMLGNYTSPPYNEETVREHADSIFDVRSPMYCMKYNTNALGRDPKEKNGIKLPRNVSMF